MGNRLARAKLARAAARLNARCGLPAIILLTDDERLSDPLAAARALPKGSMVIVRARQAAQRAHLAAGACGNRACSRSGSADRGRSSACHPRPRPWRAFSGKPRESRRLLAGAAAGMAHHLFGTFIGGARALCRCDFAGTGVPDEISSACKNTRSDSRAIVCAENDCADLCTRRNRCANDHAA